MHSLKIYLFGKFRIEAEERPLPGFESSKAQELFWFLLCRRDRPQSRESLAELLWRNSSPSQSKKYLRQALWHMQQTVNEVFKQRHNHLIQADYDYVTLHTRDRIWLDVASYETAFSSCAKIPGRDLTAEQTEALLNAVELYRGDLLEGCYQDWCLCERERLKNMYLNMLNKLLSYSEEHNDFEVGILIGDRILSVDNVSERAHRRLMKLYYLAGDRPSALRQYARCRRALEDELGVRPSKSTIELYEQICNDSLQTKPLSNHPSNQADRLKAELRTTEPANHLANQPSGHRQSQRQDLPDPLPEIINRLQRLCGILTALQQTVHEEIESVEDALRTLH
jgi:DNA-binding SARP family transcriptional activator